MVSAPQNMIAYGTDTFDVRDFVHAGLLVFSLTYWPWMGFLTKTA